MKAIFKPHLDLDFSTGFIGGPLTKHDNLRPIFSDTVEILKDGEKLARTYF